MSDELKPCPFCGGKPEHDNSDDGPHEWIFCTDCGTRGPIVNYNRAKAGGAVAAWNRRVTPP